MAAGGAPPEGRRPLPNAYCPPPLHGLGKIAIVGAMPLTSSLTARVLASGPGWSVNDVVCTAGPHDRPYEEQRDTVSIAAVIAEPAPIPARNVSFDRNMSIPSGNVEDIRTQPAFVIRPSAFVTARATECRRPDGEVACRRPTAECVWKADGRQRSELTKADSEAAYTISIASP